MYWYLNWGKRLIDFVLAAGGLLLLSPIIALLCVAILVVERHNPIFSQTRIGLHGAPFTLHKLRTMPPKTPDLPTHVLGEQKISKLGQALRRAKLDELPQLFNVLVGHMSLVGPRPSLPNQKKLISEREKLQVLRVRPGITGLSQINGIDMSDPEKLALSDAQYTKKVALHTDLKILAETLLAHR
ncbi:MAG: sugar transferase [Pseudomonadota bacterium]